MMFWTLCYTAAFATVAVSVSSVSLNSANLAEGNSSNKAVIRRSTDLAKLLSLSKAVIHRLEVRSDGHAERRTRSINSDEHVPRLIHQSHKLPFDELPEGMKNAMQQWKEMNPLWEHKYYSDSDLERMVAESKDEALQMAFGKLKNYLPNVGAARADLMRYYIIYQQGGVWADSDTAARGPLETQVNISEDDYVSSLGAVAHTRPTPSSPDLLGPHQWLIVAARGHPVLRVALEKTIKNIMAWDTSIQGLGGPSNNIEGLGGPPVLQEAMMQVLNVSELTSGVHYCLGTESSSTRSFNVRLLPGSSFILGLGGAVLFKRKDYLNDLEAMNSSYWIDATRKSLLEAIPDVGLPIRSFLK